MSFDPKPGDFCFWYANPYDNRFGKTLPSRIYRITKVDEIETRTWGGKEKFSRVDAVMIARFDGLKWIPVKKSKETRIICDEKDMMTKENVQYHVEQLQNQIKFLETMVTCDVE